MKTTLRLGRVLVAICAMTLWSCDDNDDVNEPVIPGGNYGVTYITFDRTMEDPQFIYNPANGAWNGCFNPSMDTWLTYGNVNFTHTGGTSYGYEVWNGFCPSVSTDTQAWPDTDWTSHQWSVMGGAGIMVENGVMRTVTGAPFMVGFWDVSESTDGIPASPSLKIQPVNGVKFIPVRIYVNNSTYAYYCMRDGSSFNRAFTAEDKFIVKAIGVRGGKQTGTVEIPLAADGKFVTSWQAADLTGLGTVDYIYFQMSSTDNGEWGMNNPAYFCVGAITLEAV